MEEVEALRSPGFRVIYEGKDITADVSKALIELSYTDNTEDASDEVSISMEDVDGLWRGEWYPKKGDRMTVEIGYKDTGLLNCGTFEVDETTIQGPPDTIAIKALATGISKAVRTKNAVAYDGQTLRQIATKVASRLGMTVQGDITATKLVHVTQSRERDLSFLKRLAAEYGYIFSVRDTVITFMSIFELEKADAVLVLDRTDLSDYSIRDKTSTTFASARVRHYNPDTDKVIDFTYDKDLLPDGQPRTDVTAVDDLNIRSRVDSQGEAETKAKAAMYRANSLQQELDFSTEGNPLICAGNNIEFTGLGVLSGKYQITSSTHAVDSGGGYKTTGKAKRVGYVEKVKQKSTRPRKKTNATYRVIS